MKVWSLLLGIATFGLCAAAADAVLVEQIVAKVNGDIITRSEVDRLRKMVEIELRQRGATPQQLSEAMKEQEQHLLRDRIDQLLLIQRSRDMSINVDSEVSKWLGEIQAQNKIADPEQFQKWVTEQAGMTFEDFKQEAKNNMLTQRVVGAEVASKISVPKAEIEKIYNENKASFVRQEQVFLRELLVATEGKEEAGVAAAEKKAKDLVARARKGERFGDLIRDNSDAASARQGGDLGGAKKGDLMKEIEDLVWDKPRGHVTDPIKVAAGFLILRVEEHHKEGQATLDEVENEIRDRLFSPQFEPKRREYLTQLRRDAFLEIRDGWVDSGAATEKDTKWRDPAMLRPETITKEEVAASSRNRRLLWMFPIPGTSMRTTGTSSSR